MTPVVSLLSRRRLISANHATRVETACGAARSITSRVDTGCGTTRRATSRLETTCRTARRATSRLETTCGTARRATSRVETACGTARKATSRLETPSRSRADVISSRATECRACERIAIRLDERLQSPARAGRVVRLPSRPKRPTAANPRPALVRRVRPASRPTLAVVGWIDGFSTTLLEADPHVVGGRRDTDPYPRSPAA